MGASLTLASTHGHNLNVLAMPKSQRRPPKKRGTFRPTRGEGFGQGDRPLRAAVYARVSAAHQQTIPMQLRQLREYAKRRGWRVAHAMQEVMSGAKQRPVREELMAAARRRDIDVVLVWRLDRWGRSLSDLVLTLKELQELGVAFVSLTEAFDLTTPTGRAMAGMVAVFAEFEREIRRERVSTGIEQARREGRHLGRPRSASLKAKAVQRLFGQNVSKSEIARQLGIGRTSVRRILDAS
jgi:putative DNA-invertase from lambdoid prophage Rac